jgi:hypothetical protein
MGASVGAEGDGAQADIMKTASRITVQVLKRMVILFLAKGWFAVPDNPLFRHLTPIPFWENCHSQNWTPNFDGCEILRYTIFGISSVCPMATEKLMIRRL